VGDYEGKAMSIIFPKPKMQVVMGNGDVGVYYGVRGVTGAIAFGNIPKTTIGTLTEPLKNISVDDFPVSLIFTDARSVDVVISILEKVKKAMAEPVINETEEE
jgi:hypothetical protein